MIKKFKYFMLPVPVAVILSFLMPPEIFEDRALLQTFRLTVIASSFFYFLWLYRSFRL